VSIDARVRGPKVNPRPDLADRPARILIVDNERRNSQVLEGMLTPEGFLVQTAASGEEALAIVARHPPDLILLDILMPGMDGYQVVGTVKRDLATKNIPVIMVTALNDHNSRIRALGAGAEDFLTQPVDRAELCVRVRNLLRLKAFGDYYDKYSHVLEGEVGSRTADLVESERLYRSTFDAAPVGIAHVDLDGQWLRVNQRLCDLLGYSREELQGIAVHGLLQSEQQPGEAESFRRMAAGTLDRHVVDEKRYRRQDGSFVLARVNMSVHRDAEGQPQHFISVIEDITEMKRAEQELRASSEQLRNLAAHLLSVREDERARISREVHDELGQSLTAVKMDLAWLEGRLPRRNGQMLKRIRSTRQLADSMIQSIRRISTELRPAVLDLGLAAAVEWQVQEFQARSGIQCTVRLLTREVVASNASTAMFRIFQETLTNVARHANATRAEVVLQRQRDGLVLLIRDNGRGFDQADPSPSKSLGLLGMRERAAILGGRVNVISALGKGTTVTAWIPLPSPEESGTVPTAIP
jgi:PAS domain S-box-containing protein